MNNSRHFIEYYKIIKAATVFCESLTRRNIKLGGVRINLGEVAEENKRLAESSARIKQLILH